MKSATIDKQIFEDDLALTTAVKLSKDLKLASSELGSDQGRYLVQQYYTIQENRITAAHQARKLLEAEKPSALVSYVHDQMALVELQIKNALDEWTSSPKVPNYKVCSWLRNIKGIGPVITAGLVANLDIEKAPTAGGFMRFVGIDPTAKWEKGKKRPWNAFLKVLVVFKAMESFVKVQNKDGAFYGKLFAVYKKKLVEANEQGLYKERAKELLATRKYRDDTDVVKSLKEGKLCKAHIHAMARRKVAKLFISHLHEVMYWDRYGKVGPLPYPIVHLNLEHVHYIDIPNMKMFEGFAEARKAQFEALGKPVPYVSSPSSVNYIPNKQADEVIHSLDDILPEEMS